jgi:isopentenyldiphosphate isomerase
MIHIRADVPPTIGVPGGSRVRPAWAAHPGGKYTDDFLKEADMIDPATEIFDLCDRDGNLIGVQKPRALVHRDGDWHRSFHCWVVTTVYDFPGIVLQKRADRKDTWPGLWDVSVAGHYSAGEGIEGGLREMREELGLTVKADELIHTGWRREEVHYENGLIEREVQDVYFLPRDVGLNEMRSDPEEVSGVAVFPADALLGLTRGERAVATVPGGAVDADGRIQVGSIDVLTTDLVPRVDNYYAKAVRYALTLASANALVRGRHWW